MNNPSYRPFIGINLEHRPAYRGVPEVDFINADYVDAVVKAGGIPVLLPPVDDLELIPDVLERLDGVLFIGGADLDPRNDHYQLHSSVRSMSSRRELFDRALMKEVSKRRMPVMGVGVGMQLLNVVQGGALFLDIAEDLPNALLHRNPENDYSLRHCLIVEKGTLLHSVYGDNAVRVNSCHHMAVDDVAPGFIVSARCPGYVNDKKEKSDARDDVNFDDSVIEAIESCMDDWFAFGVQFHPEVKTSATDLDRQIFKKFVEGVVAYKENGLNILTLKPHSKESSMGVRKNQKAELLVRKTIRS